MHISKLEKFGASLLVVAWLLFGVNAIGNFLVSADKAAPAHGEAQVASTPATPAAPAEPEKTAVELLAQASADTGKKQFNKCKACHSVDEGGPNKVGPHLWGVVGRNVASISDFSYSSALSDMGGTWSYEHLDKFLTSPKSFAPGTKMTFAGLKDPALRADLILFLRENTPSPPPLP